MGRLVAAPLFGWWCEQRTYREAILINLTLFFIGAPFSLRCYAHNSHSAMMCNRFNPKFSSVVGVCGTLCTGNLMYALAEHHKWLILFSRLLVGLGSGECLV